jgi:hypothetical protein
MPGIDPRLLDCESQPELTENFNRILALLDALEARVETLETPET